MGRCKKKLDTSFIVGHTKSFLRHVPNEGLWAPEWASMEERVEDREFSGGNAETVMTLEPPEVAYKVDVALAKCLVALGGAQSSFTISSNPSVYISLTALQGSARRLFNESVTFLSWSDVDNILSAIPHLHVLLGLAPPDVADKVAWVRQMYYCFTSPSGNEILAQAPSFFQDLFTYVYTVRSKIVGTYASYVLSSAAGHILAI